MLKTKVILLDIFPRIKRAYIVVCDKFTGRNLSMIKLEYFPDIKDIELQVLLHGYKILKKECESSDLETYDLESI